MNNAIMNTPQVAFSSYQAYTGFQSLSGLEQSAADAVNGRAASYSRVDFGFHSTSMYTTAERSLVSNGAYLVESQSDPMALASRRPGGTGTAEEQSPVGDAILPLLIMLTGYVLMRVRKRIAAGKHCGK